MVSHTFKAERDALAISGVLAFGYLTWDPPIAAGVDSAGLPDFTHFRGLNIQALIVDNRDGEVLALEKNAIHDNDDPTRHAEPAAMRAALARLRQKWPRPPEMSVEQYYRSHLFYADGDDDEAYYRRGCTLLTSLEPCPMCAATLLVGRMKRVAYTIADGKYGGGWPLLKERFYKKYQLRYEAAARPVLKDGFLGEVAAKLEVIDRKIEALRVASVQDTWFLDRLHGELGEVLQVLGSARTSDLRTTGEELAINTKTLSDLQRWCRLPVPA